MSENRREWEKSYSNFRRRGQTAASLSLVCLKYRIDRYDNIVNLGQGWDELTIHNEVSHLNSRNVLGTSFWNYISDADTRNIYFQLLKNVRNTGLPVLFHFRCDSHTWRQYMEMTLIPYNAMEIEFQNTILLKERRSSVILLSSRVSRGKETVVLCSWCNNIQTPLGWKMAEEAIQILGFKSQDELPTLTYRTCDTCREKFKIIYAK